MDTSVLLPAGIGVFYTLLILVSLQWTAQRSTAVHIGSEIAESNFALREGYTIVGVIDNTRARRFSIGNDVMDEQRYA